MQDSLLGGCGQSCAAFTPRLRIVAVTSSRQDTCWWLAAAWLLVPSTPAAGRSRDEGVSSGGLPALSVTSTGVGRLVVGWLVTLACTDALPPAMEGGGVGGTGAKDGGASCTGAIDGSVGRSGTVDGGAGRTGAVDGGGGWALLLLARLVATGETCCLRHLAWSALSRALSMTRRMRTKHSKQAAKPPSTRSMTTKTGQR